MKNLKDEKNSFIRPNNTVSYMRDKHCNVCITNKSINHFVKSDKRTSGQNFNGCYRSICLNKRQFSDKNQKQLICHKKVLFWLYCTLYTIYTKPWLFKR